MLDTPVFGPFGILSGYDDCITDDNYYLITVEHLLRHQGGFSSRGGDPVFSPYDSRESLLKTQLRRRLAFEPGTWQEYSNFGFLLLSLVIEKVAGMPYETFMQEAVFGPAGCREFRLAGNYLQDRLPGETRYYMQPDAEKTVSPAALWASSISEKIFRPPSRVFPKVSSSERMTLVMKLWRSRR